MFKQTLGMMVLGGVTILISAGCSGNPTSPDWTDLHSLRPSDAPVAASHPNGEATSYFPLGEGDVWIYEMRGGEEAGPVGSSRVTVRAVAGQFEQGAVRLEGYLFPLSDASVEFANDSGVTHEFTTSESAAWYPWCDFGIREAKIHLPEFGDDCFHGSRGRCLGTSRVSVPAGEFDHAATIEYETRLCQDLGVFREVLAPRVGLIERTVVSLEGEVTWSLVYARVGLREWGGIDAPPREPSDSVDR